MRTYFIEIAVIDSAAKLYGINLTDNYAVFGSLKRFRNKNLESVQMVKGIEDIKDRAESFRFGTRCGKVLARYMDKLTPQQILSCEAKVARIFFAPQIAADPTISADDKKATLKAVIKSLVKRSQIRTHTAKPGSEDINTWLDRYNELQKDFTEGLDAFVNAMVSPDEETVRMGDSFINEEDAVVKRILSGVTEGLEQALAEKPSCTFGLILREIMES